MVTHKRNKMKEQVSRNKTLKNEKEKAELISKNCDIITKTTNKIDDESSSISDTELSYKEESTDDSVRKYNEDSYSIDSSKCDDHSPKKEKMSTKIMENDEESDEAGLELNEDVVENELHFINTSEMLTKVLEVKRDLLTVYLINLKLYNKLPEEEKEFTPIKPTLVKLSILLEKIVFVEKKTKDKMRNDSKEIKDAKREAPKYIIENKGLTKKRKKEESNPRVKNRRKARDLFEKGRKQVDKNISDKKTRTSKFD